MKKFIVLTETGTQMKGKIIVQVENILTIRDQPDNSYTIINLVRGSVDVVESAKRVVEIIYNKPPAD